MVLSVTLAWGRDRPQPRCLGDENVGVVVADAHALPVPEIGPGGGIETGDALVAVTIAALEEGRMQEPGVRLFTKEGLDAAVVTVIERPHQLHVVLQKTQPAVNLFQRRLHVGTEPTMLGLPPAGAHHHAVARAQARQRRQGVGVVTGIIVDVNRRGRRAALDGTDTVLEKASPVEGEHAKLKGVDHAPLYRSRHPHGGARH